jgi:hypothetical protein
VRREAGVLPEAAQDVVYVQAVGGQVEDQVRAFYARFSSVKIFNVNSKRITAKKNTIINWKRITDEKSTRRLHHRAENGRICSNLRENHGGRRTSEQ